MRCFCFFFLATISSLFASFSEPTRWEYTTGYRNDRLHWHLKDPGDGCALFYSEIYKNLQFWQNALSMTVYQRDIYFFLSGAYSAFGVGGEVRQRYGELDFTKKEPRFLFTPKGWAADGEARLGYCINLTDGRIYKTVLIPFIGFSGHWESLSRHSFPPSKEVGSFTRMASELPGQLNLTWYGFLLGGMFHIDPVGPLLFDVGYYYSWLHVRLHTHYGYSVDSSGASQTVQDAIKAKMGGNLGHTGWLKAMYRLTDTWQIGLGALINYFVSRDFSIEEHQHTSLGESVEIPEKLKIRWTTISGWVSLSKSF